MQWGSFYLSRKWGARLGASGSCWLSLLGPDFVLLVLTGVGPFGGQQPGVPLGYPIKAPKLPGKSEGGVKRHLSPSLTAEEPFVGAHFWSLLSLVGSVRKPVYRTPLLVASKEKHGEAILQVLASLTCTPVPTRMHTQAQRPPALIGNHRC